MAANAIGKGFSGRAATYWHMLPQADQARKALWDAVNPKTGKRRIDEAFPYELRAATRENEMFIRFKSGSTYQVVGSDNFESLIGSPPAGIVFSEWSKAKPQAWGLLSPILAENGGWAVFIYTPRGRNHGLRLLETARKTPGWFGEVLDADETGVLTPEALQEALTEYEGIYGKEYAYDLWRQEFYCDFQAPMLGAVYAREFARVDKEGRICRVEHDPSYPVFTAWDLGYSDDTGIWFYQVIAGEIRILEYVAANQKGVDYYAAQVLGREVQLDIIGGELVCTMGAPIPEIAHRRAYQYARHWLPHDARAKTMAAMGKSIIEQLAKALTLAKLAIAPELGLEDGIQAARLMFQRCYFDADGTAEGIEALRNYHRAFDEKKAALRDTPVHDWTSHGADAFRILAVAWREEAKLEEKPKPQTILGVGVGAVNAASLNDLWAESDRRQRLAVKRF